ncbi:MAG: NAD(P)-binding domain-containing protein [bacterium]|nr:NAD(P)-binding domain-containing protein [bacterium]
METTSWVAAALVLAPGLALALYFARSSLREERRSVERKDISQASGLTEPASLHPVIDPLRCIGCATCVDACPEGKILGIIEGKAQLVEPTRCIGHGACKSACPTDAIELVFGTERRGVEIPEVRPNFETNIPGIFIAGELGGMGLIRNAVEQGRQAIESVGALGGPRDASSLDVVIVGAGPAGISASLAAKEAGLRFMTVEQETLGGTVAHYPRGKIVMTRPAVLPIVGKTRFTETTKEALLAFWKGVEEEAGLDIRYNERLERVARDGEAFDVTTTRGSYRARAVLLAIGRRGTPRKLGVDGEELPKVYYRLVDPEQFQGKRVLVVGGGDSALEAAAALSDSAEVTLSYRSPAFNRAKEKNRVRIDELSAAGKIRLMLQSNVREIRPDHVTLEAGAESLRLPNDNVIVCAGGILPTPFLRELGIEVSTKFGTR